LKGATVSLKIVTVLSQHSISQAS